MNNDARDCMTPSRQDRRTFVRNAAVLGSVSVLGGLAGCSDDVVALDTDDGTEPAADELDLRTGMEIGTVFTAAGGQLSRSEVDPDEPGGGRLVTVGAVEPGEQVTLTWRQTVERKVTPEGTPDRGVGTETPTPEVEVVEETGTITVSGLATSHEPYLPMYWKPGETTTETSAIWLSTEAYRELKETRQTDWTADVLTRISWVGPEAMDRIHDGVATVDDVSLEADAEFVDFELTVDGQRTAVEAIRAHDSFGNEYIILANEANPLVVKFTYDAVSVGFTGFDTGLWTLIKAVFSGYQVVSIDAP